MRQDLLSYKNKLNNRSQKGYTLLEVAISILFFAIITMGLSLPLNSSVNLTVDNRNINAANNLARSYLNDLKAKWIIQSNFDAGELIETTDMYTNNGKYNVIIDSENISFDNNGAVVIKRVNIKYQDSKDNPLTDIYYDYNRPGSI